MNDQELVTLFNHVIADSTFSGKSVDLLWPDTGVPDGRYIGMTINRSDGRGVHLISPSSYEALLKIVDGKILQSDLLGRVSRGTALRELKAQVSEKLFQRNVEVSVSLCAKICRHVQIQCSRYKKTYTYVFPMAFTFEKDPIEFNVGPAKFVTSLEFRKSLKSKLRELRAEKTHKDQRSYRDQLARVLKQYRSYNWFCILEAQEFEGDIGREAAERSAKIAIGVLQVLFSGPRTERIRLLKSIPSDVWTGLFYYDHQNEQFGYKFTQQSESIGIKPGWKEEILEDEASLIFLSVVGEVVSQSLNNFSLFPAAARVANSLMWFTEANYSDNDKVGTSKYIVALEALFNTSKEGVALKVSERATAFHCLAEDTESFETVLKRAKSFYNARSDFLHGQVTIGDELSKIRRHDVQRFVAEVIFSFSYFLRGGVIKPDLKGEEYENWLERVVEHSKRQNEAQEF